MDQEEESRVDAAFQEHCFHGKEYILDAVVMKALRELGLTPSEEELAQLISEGAGKGEITFRDFRRMYLILKDSVPGEEQIKNALRVFDVENTGYIDKGTLYHTLTTCGESLTEKEADALFTNAECSMSDGFGGKVSIEAFAQYLLKRHCEAAKTHKQSSEPSEPELADETDKQMKDAAQYIRSLREIRNDVINKAAQAAPQRLQGLQELIQVWFRNSHVRFLSYDGPQPELNYTTGLLEGCTKKELIVELSDICESLEVPAVQSPLLGFHKVCFHRNDTTSHSATFFLSEHDGTVTDVRRLVAAQVRLAINNIVFTVRYDNTYKIISGHSAERGGGSFLNQLFAAYTELTGDDSPSGFEVIVFRQPDIVQCQPLSEGYPMDDSIVSQSLSNPQITMSRSPGIPLTGNTAGDAILFADTLQHPGESRQSGPAVTIEMSPLALSHRKKIIAIKVSCDLSPFKFRVATSVDISSWQITNNGQPLSLYHWHAEGPSAWSGFSLSTIPVMVQCSKDKTLITNILCEFEHTGLYYISDSEIEVICDENFLHEKNNKTFDQDGKPRSHGGHPYLRAWGWTRKGIKIRSKKDPEPAISYLGSEFSLPEWILAPSKNQHRLSQDQTSGRTAVRGDRETPLSLSPSIQYSVHDAFFRSYSLLLSCDSQYHFDTAGSQPWVHVPESQSNSIIRLSVMCYAMSANMTLQSHPYSHVVPTFDKDITGTTDIYTIPTGKCRGAGLLLKRYSEAPEHALRRQIPQLLGKDAGFQLSVMDFVRMRNEIDEPWQFGYITQVEGNDVRVHSESSTGESASYKYIIPDFNRLFEKKGIAQLTDTFCGSTAPLSDALDVATASGKQTSGYDFGLPHENDFPASLSRTTPQESLLEQTSSDIPNVSSQPRPDNAPDADQQTEQPAASLPPNKSRPAKPKDAKSDGCCCAVA